MKKRMKKLVLAKETVQGLEARDLRGIAGQGWTDKTCNNLLICWTYDCPTFLC